MACIEAEEAIEDCSEATWTRREQARQRQIAIGKARPEYRRYVQEVPRDQRDSSHPQTPESKARVSKRQFDRTLSAWRCRLHEYDVPRATVEGNKADADVTPLARRASKTDELDSTTTMAPSDPRSCLVASEETGVVPLRLADALLSGTPVTPHLGHHLMHAAHLIPMVGQPHLQLGPRQLDFGVLPKWQSPLDGTPSTMCSTLSPMTPAPRSRPVLQHQTVYENETPDRPEQPQYHAFGHQTIGEHQKTSCRTQPSPSRQDRHAPTTPPRTPPRKFLMESGTEDVSLAVGSSSARRHHSPPSSVAKTPYGMWPHSTPSPTHMYRREQAPTFTETTTASMYVDSRSNAFDVPPMLPHQQFHYQMHAPAVQWGMFPTSF